MKKSDYYKLLNESIYKNRLLSSFSFMEASVKPLETFSSSDSIKLPLPIQGRLITSGTYDDLVNEKITLPPEELKKTTKQWEGVFIYKSHGTYQAINSGKDVNIDDVAGKIIKTVWNEKDQAIDFFAEVYDSSIALKILNGLIKFISVGFHRDIVSKNGSNLVKNIEPVESSLVFRPRDSNAEFHVSNMS